MMEKLMPFLRKIFPFLTVIFLWRMAIPFWNPGGILALIPIFFCTFIRPTPWFMPFGLIFCFLIDYNLDTLCYWTVIYLLCYAINGFQIFVDLQDLDYNAVDVFMIFVGVGIILSEILHLNWTTFGRMIWTFAWLVTLYLPITNLIKVVRHDR
jgi:hypothetical protein